MILHVKDPFHPLNASDEEKQISPHAHLSGPVNLPRPGDQPFVPAGLSWFTGQGDSKPTNDPKAQPQREGPSAQRRPLRILVAEDTKPTREAVLRYLDYLGYTADVATDGRAALAAMWRQPYDLVLMDIQMPDIDGIEATRRIREDWPPGFQPHIVAMTAHALEINWKQLLDDGIIGCLIKPFSMDELAEVLDKCARMKDDV